MTTTKVLLSGQNRTFGANVANLYWSVFRKLENPVFYFSIADDAEAKDAHMLEAYYPADRIHIERVKQPDDFPKMPPFVLAKHAPYAPTPNNPSVVLSIMRQLWAYKRVWQFMVEKTGENYDGTFLRVRPDLFFHRFDMPPLPYPSDFYGPWKATCGGVNDRFSVMGGRAAYAYFMAFDHLTTFLDAGCPLHPESIQLAALEAAGCAVMNTLSAEFTCMRLSGRDHVPLVEYPGELARFIEATRHLPPKASVWRETVTLGSTRTGT